MQDTKQTHEAPNPALLTRLRRDVRGNTLAIMAASMFPLLGMIGGGVDMARIYLTKTRLQQACDAGALGGRKVMGGGLWTANSNAAPNAATNFFSSNFADGAYGTENLSYSYSESGGTVAGTASVTVPMTLMKVFDINEKQLTVTCQAAMRLPNTDVMFVLDTTGSMASTLPGDTQPKIDALRTAVKCFYEIVARVDTSATCAAGTPSGGLSSQVQVRFGFVPYSTNVRVGYLLKTDWVADQWEYQTRRAEASEIVDSAATTSSVTTGSWSGYSNVSSTTGNRSCPSAPADTVSTPVAGASYDTAKTPPPYNTASNGAGVSRSWETRSPTSWTRTNYRINSSGRSPNITCTTQARTRTENAYTSVQHTEWANWTYDQLPVNISGLKNGSDWRSSFDAAVGPFGDMRTLNWDGCIEERSTVKRSSYDPIPNEAYDLNIDLVPTSDDDTKWAPALPGLIFLRGAVNSGDNDDPTKWNRQKVDDTRFNYINNPVYTCASRAEKLQTWSTTPSGGKLPIENYVDGLAVGGNTYHDIGMIWGARLMSPTGIFASENALTPQGGEIERHMIFMTDGETCTSEANYAAYGHGWYDRRQTDSGNAPTGGCETATAINGTLSEQVIARYQAVCSAIKNKNITLWVIWFGASVPTTENRLKTCGTSGRFFSARNSAQLQTTFSSIANQISQLRLVQ